MPMYRCVKRSFVGGRVREVGDVLEMETGDHGSAWVPAESPETPEEQPITDPLGLYGPAVPDLPKGKKAKPAN